ncbi:MAG: hypothetical protein N2559_18490, partial [Anaerolineae bacterium]|nr:hypothetical protein [Anaerolineae bacterium]
LESPSGQGTVQGATALVAQDAENSFVFATDVRDVIVPPQGFVDVDVLRQMGELRTITGEDYSLPELRGLTREALIALLDRAAEIGLLTAHGHGYYSIHPALPWYFKSLFDTYYRELGTGVRVQKDGLTPGSSPLTPALRAYVEAIGALGDYYHDQYIDGNRDVIDVLRMEEANLLHAWRLARANGWWRRVISTM